MRIGNAQQRRFCILVAVGIAAFHWMECSLAQQGAAPAIVINEIMYLARATEHAEDPKAEFIELRNVGDRAIELEGWKFSSGVRYTFPERLLEPGAYLVVAADPDGLRSSHPGVTNVIGPFRGKLSNGGEEIELENADGARIDRVSYADSGFWARRVSQKLKGYDDWVWDAPHDGGGHSLELLNARLSNDHGHNWLPSVNPGGTPGKVNSVAVDNVAPLVTGITHDPIIPNASEEVRIRVGIVDESPGNLKVVLNYRPDGQSMFERAAMSRGEGGFWLAGIPPMKDRTVVQFYVEATDGEGLARQHPQLVTGSTSTSTSASETQAIPQRQALCLYQVEDDFDEAAARKAGAKPTYRIISTKAEWALIRKLNGISGRSRVYDSHIHCTFINVDGVDTELRYQVSARIRGHGSRANFPPGLRVSFPGDAPWRGVTDINLNSQYTHSQALGAVIHQLAGFASARSTPVHVRMNGDDWTAKESPQFGCYVHNEVLDGEFVEKHFPGETDGNLYRLVGSANLNDRGSDISRYRSLYSKRNHGSRDDYSDILELIKVLNERPGPDYIEHVNNVVDVEQWARYIALDALLCNQEGGMSDGRGDDVAIFSREDGRFQLVPYDLDSIVGLGEQNRNIRKSIYNYGNMAGLRQLFREPEFMRLYIAQFHKLTETVYNTPILFRAIDDLLGGWIPDDEIERIKEFIPRRIAFVMDQIRSETVIGSTLDQRGGIHRSSGGGFALYGRFDIGNVRMVTVGGVEPRIFHRTGSWILTADRVGEIVRPGINQIPVVMTGHSGDYLEQRTLRVLVDEGSVRELSGHIAGADLDLQANEGPYLLKGDVVVGRGSTLTIGPGVTIYAGPGARLAVRGVLNANGTDDQRIVFTADPRGATVSDWNGIEIIGGHGQPHILSHVDLLDVAQGLKVTAATAAMDGILFAASGAGTVLLEQSDVTVRNSTFRASASSSGDPHVLVSVQRGDVSFKNCEFERDLNDGAAIDAQSEAKHFRLVGNRFVGGGSPALVVGEGAFIDSNDFLTEPSESPTIEMRSMAPLIVTRNRTRGSTPIVPDGNHMNGLIAGNENSAGALSRRAVITAEAEILAQPPRRSSSVVAMEVGGPGITAFRYSVNDGPWSEPMDAGSSRLVLEGLQPGQDYRVALLGRNAIGDWQREDEATISDTVRVFAGLTTVRLSEILAVRESGEHGDYVELHNYGIEPVDLGGYSISDDPEKIRKHVLPAETIIEPGAFRVFKAEQSALGFALSGEGETITLHAPRAHGSSVLDRVTFGLQLPDHSVSVVSGEWTLSQPTPGEPNVQMTTGTARDLRISEWLAVGSASSPDEFVELRNRGNQPVALSGLTLTDNIGFRRGWRPFPVLSYIGGNEAHAFRADGKPGKGADHLDFRLAREGEVLGLMDEDGALIDFAVFGTQTTGVSQGRADGDTLGYHERPSPGDQKVVSVSDADQLVLDSIRISEIHYHPSKGDGEFIELVNIGTTPAPMAGVRFADGIEFIFQADAVLQPGAYAVLVKQRARFRKEHGSGVPIAGEFGGKLSNSGEKLRLETATGATVVEVDYSDKWYRSSDGGDHSLVIVDPAARRLSVRKAWRASHQKGGSPGEADAAPVTPR